MTSITRILRRFIGEEDGITGLGTAGILSSLIIAGSALSGVVLSSGLEATDLLKSTMTASIERVTGNVEVRGMVVATSSNRTPNAITFNLAPAVGSRVINVNPNDAANTLVFNYSDSRTHASAVPFRLHWLVRGDDDDLLEAGELVEITLPLPVGSDSPCPCVPTANERFMIEVIVPSGGMLAFERTLPAAIRPVMPLH